MKQPECTFRATLTEMVEEEVEALYRRIRLHPGCRGELEQALRHRLELMVQDTQQQLAQLTATRQRLVHQWDKLLQAHYEDAIPLVVCFSVRVRFWVWDQATSVRS
ncbi:hypothetical protein ACSL103130_05915 [Actinomyces slackii]|uniref:Uncharacterized protein n=1 Tax=Actinomyces slackii TaxID=52774 RepID=A0A448KE70_9ACTO|nr:hypothetical protein [Actinomyces slackii]VEG75188.1 Uncharacterised protein [Actinomyces slackii]